MRFLCLHGAGTSASIFKNQTASFRAKLTLNPPPTFDFVDGPFPSSPAAGIDLFYNPPYYSFFGGTTTADIKEAHAWLLNLIARDGPYDGVMTFSQGGALASTLLLQLAISNLPAPFKVGIFICGGMPLKVLDDLGLPVSQIARDWDENSRQALFAQADSKAILASGKERWTGVTTGAAQSYNPSNKIDEADVFGLDFSSFPAEYRIQIPTVHIYGSRDPRYPASVQLAQFCEEDKRQTYDHGSGHEIPRNAEVSKAIASLVEWSTKMAQLSNVQDVFA